MRPTGYWDRTGWPITLKRWGELFAKADYKIVRRTPVEPGSVITAWMGYDGFEGPGIVVDEPLIFGTLLWDGREFFDATETEALKRHEHWVRWANCWRNHGKPADDELMLDVHNLINDGATLTEVAAGMGITPQSLGRRLRRFRQRHRLEGRVPYPGNRRDAKHPGAYRAAHG